MSVSSIFSNAITPTDPLSAFAPSTPATQSSSGGTSSLTAAASATSVSGNAALLSRLQQLSFSSPAAFKTATAGIATQLQTDATQTDATQTGGSQGQALSSLAAKFQQASQTGELPSLPAHAHHGGHHHGGGSAASAAAAYQDATDSTAATASASLPSQLSTALSQALTQDTGIQSGTLIAQSNLAKPVASLA